MALLLAIPAMAAKIPSGTTLYLKPKQGTFYNNDERFEAYFYGDGEAWVTMKRVSGETAAVFEATAPGTGKNYSNVIFVRMNPNGAEHNWNSKWNQTGNLTYDGENNCFTPSSWDGATGNWSTYTPPAVPAIKTFEANLTNCFVGNTVTFTSTCINNGTNSVVYKIGNEIIGSTWTPQATGTYTVTATLQGAEESVSLKVTVTDAPEGFVYYEDEFVVFVENTTKWSNIYAYTWGTVNGKEEHYGGDWPGAKLTTKVNINGKEYYKWTYAGLLETAPTSLIFTNNTGAQTSNLTYFNGGVYNTNGECFGYVNPTPYPTITLAADKLNPYIDEEVTFTATVEHQGDWALSFYIDGAKQTTSGNTFTHTFATAGTYNVVAKVEKEGYEAIVSDAVEVTSLYTEGIESEKCYFLVLDNNWTTAAGDYYYAKFINKNTGAYTWVYGAVENTTVVFYLSQYNVLRSDDMPTYTHVVFFKFKSDVELPENLTVADIEAGFDAADTTKSDEIALDATNNIYTIGGEISTGIESVVVADGIRYAYGVVEAKGAIEVYNINGTVVARGNDNVDLAGLGRGVYIIRNGNQVRKVVR